MPTIETQHLLPSVLHEHIQSICAAAKPFPQAAVSELYCMDEPTVVTLMSRARPVKDGPLLVWLPDARPEQLLALARTEPLVENHTSTDLLTNRTYLIWRDSVAEMEVRLDTWALGDVIVDSERRVRIVFAGPGHAIACKFSMDAEEVEALLCDLQAAESSSGPNWQPWRIYSDEEMMLAKGQLDVAEPGVLVPRVLTLNLRD